MAFQEASGWCKRCNGDVLVRRDKANDLLHLILTLLTCGLWLLVWIGTAVRFGGWRCTRCGRSARCRGNGLAGALLFLIAAVVIAFGVNGLIVGVHAIREKRKIDEDAPARASVPVGADAKPRPEARPAATDAPPPPPDTSTLPPALPEPASKPPVLPPQPPVTSADPIRKPPKKPVMTAEERLESNCRDWFSAAKGYRASGLVELATNHLQKVIDNSRDAQLVSEAKRLKAEIVSGGR